MVKGDSVKAPEIDVLNKVKRKKSKAKSMAMIETALFHCMHKSSDVSTLFLTFLLGRISNLRKICQSRSWEKLWACQRLYLRLSSAHVSLNLFTLNISSLCSLFLLACPLRLSLTRVVWAWKCWAPVWQTLPALSSQLCEDPVGRLEDSYGHCSEIRNAKSPHVAIGS